MELWVLSKKREKAGALLIHVSCWPRKYEGLSSIPRSHINYKLEIMTHTCDPSTGEAETVSLGAHVLVSHAYSAAPG